MNIEKEISDYIENEESILHWTQLKGTFRYEHIIEFLKSKNIETTWENVTNYIKYDKRLLINSFKYLIFLEELFKSFISKYKNAKQNELLRLHFIDSIEQFLDIGNEANYDGIDLETLSREKEALNELRNCVVHDKILINHSRSKCI